MPHRGQGCAGTLPAPRSCCGSAASGFLLFADAFFLICSWFSCPACVCAAAGSDWLLCCSSVVPPLAQAGAESSHFTAGHRTAPTRDSAHVSSHSHILTNVLLSSASPIPTLPRCPEPWLYSLNLSCSSCQLPSCWSH